MHWSYCSLVLSPPYNGVSKTNTCQTKVIARILIWLFSVRYETKENLVISQSMLSYVFGNMTWDHILCEICFNFMFHILIILSIILSLTQYIVVKLAYEAQIIMPWETCGAAKINGLPWLQFCNTPIRKPLIRRNDIVDKWKMFYSHYTHA